jgi:DNA-binding MarR family transcriptional regulator
MSSGGNEPGGETVTAARRDGDAEPTEDNFTVERAKELGGAFIPAFIIARSDLTHAQKLVWGKICGLSGKHGYCWATNKWLGENLLMEARTVREHIRVLVDKGLLRSSIDRIDENGAIVTNGDKGAVVERRLYPVWPTESSKDPLPTPPPSPERRTPSVTRAPEGPSPERRTSVARAPVEIRSEKGVREKPSSPAEKPAPRVKVDKEQLDHLTEAYAELRGVRPQGKEWLPIQQGVRQALLDGNTVEQIEGCMRQLAALGWTWTINTVRRWLPDYRAGKLQELRSEYSGSAGSDSPEWIDDLRDQYRRIMSRIRGIEADIALERRAAQERAQAEEIPAGLRQKMGKLLDDAGEGDAGDSIAEMEARRGELEERARDIAAKLEKAGCHVAEKVRV